MRGLSPSPTLQGMAFSPSPAASLPAAVNATTAAGQRLTLAVNVTDTSGRDLCLKWQAAANSSNSTPQTGQFSFSGQERMTWDPANQIWTSNWDWMAPLGALPGDAYTFNCTIASGSTAVLLSAASQNIQTSPFNSIYTLLWTFNGTPLATPTVYRSNADGSNPTPVCSNAGTAQLSVSVDGQLLCCSNGNTYKVYSTSSGSVVQSGTLTTNALYPMISPSGKRLAYVTDAPGPAPQTLWVCNLDGTGVTSICSAMGFLAGGTYHQPIAWSPDETRLGFVAWEPALTGFSPHTVKIDGTQLSYLPINQLFADGIYFAPDSTNVYFHQSPDLLPEGIYRYDPTTNVLANGGTALTQDINACSFAASLDGSRLYTEPFSGGLGWRASTGGTYLPVGPWASVAVGLATAFK